MTSIRRIISATALIAFATMTPITLFTFCQRQLAPVEDTPSVSGETVPVTLTASFEESKMSYAEEGTDLQPLWEVGDLVHAYKADGSHYTFAVKEVNDGVATLKGEASDGVLHLIYCPGFSVGNMTVDYTAQTGEQKTMPAVMFSDGEVKDGKGEFHFRNAGAIVGISAVKGIPLSSNVTGITVSGSNLSAAKIAISGSTLTLTATPKADDAISVGGLDLTLNDASGMLSSPVFIAVPAGAVIAKVSVALTKDPETMKKPAATPQEGVDYATIAGIRWAKWNVGAGESSAHPETDFGWYFFWGGTEGYFRYEDTWQLAKSTSFVFSYSPSSAYTAVASDYAYVGDHTFAGDGFSWKNTPYHIGSDSSTGWTKYVPADKASYWYGGGSPDNKTTLDPEDDAARANWGGTWRMPTSTEITALKNNTTSEWKENYNGTGINGRLLTSTVAGEEGHSIFIPAAGYGGDDELKHTGTIGNYWAISVTSSDPSNASGLFSSSDATVHSAESQRYHGFPVRPVLD